MARGVALTWEVEGGRGAGPGAGDHPASFKAPGRRPDNPGWALDLGRGVQVRGRLARPNETRMEFECGCRAWLSPDAGLAPAAPKTISGPGHHHGGVDAPGRWAARPALITMAR